MNNKFYQQGFSLFEVIIFVIILNLVFLAAVSLVISSLYRMQINLHQARAIFYAEELKEWLNGEREADWSALVGRAGATYCVNDQLDLQSTFTDFTTGACAFNGVSGQPPQIFRRELTLTQNTSTQITARIVVSWSESAPNGASQQFDEELVTVYTSW